ncbi:MAG: hypothetical protein SPL16_07115 [Eubacteriales bacterium]|nr:hypothetical protein [Clostridiales bacterium]MDY5710471.1 hypothetical protein [Eubacteriales bacterium]
MKKTIIRIVAVAMLALMVLTALPAFAVTFYGVAAAQTPVYEKPRSSAKVLAYVTGQVTINSQDRSSGMYNITAAYGGNNVTGWVAESSISSFSKDQGSGSTGISTNTNTNTSTNTNTNTSTASGTFSANLAAGTNIYKDLSKLTNDNRVGVVSNAGNITVNYRDASGQYVYVTIGSVAGWVPVSAISNLRSSSSGSISPANLPTSSTSAGTAGTASGVRLYEKPKSAVSKDNNIYVRSTATSSRRGATKLRNMRGKTFTVLGTDSTGSFLYADYNGTRGFVRAQDFTFTSGTVVEQKPNNNNNNTTGTTGGNVTSTNTGAAAIGTPAGVGTGSSSEKWGSITIPGAGTYPIYGNYTNKKGNLYYYDYSNIRKYNYIHTTTAKGSQVAVVMGHNMRKSKTYFHNLHHIQNAILGKSTCDYCKASCSGYGKSISASWEGSSSWEVVAFFEVPKNKAYKNILPIMAQPWNYTTSQYLSSVASYVNTFSGKSWANTSALTDNGKYMMLITCGDKTDSSNIAKLYMLLKAVG